MARSSSHCDQCTETSRSLVEAYRAKVVDEDDAEADVSLWVVHYRGGECEFELGRLYAASADPLDRITGAQVLAQLGWGDRTWLAESVQILISLLCDPDPRVIAAAACALGHRRDPSAIPHVLPLITHSDADVRFGVVQALSCHEEDAAIEGLIRLAADPERDVCNWAAFGLGSLTQRDTPDLRDTLARLLDHSDAEIRGEAMIGLARCHDPRAFPAVARELAGEFEGAWCVEAAELLADPRLLPLLQARRGTLAQQDEIRFADDFEQAEKACQPNEASPKEL